MLNVYLWIKCFRYEVGMLRTTNHLICMDTFVLVDNMTKQRVKGTWLQESCPVCHQSLSARLDSVQVSTFTTETLLHLLAHFDHITTLSK